MYGNYNNYQTNEQSYSQNAVVSKSFMANVFGWMGGALIITAVVSFLFAANSSLFSTLINPLTGKMTVLGWIVMFAPLGFVLLMSLGFQRLSATAMVLLFIAYSAIMGMSFCFIFYVYSLGSIFLTFAITAGMFGVMAITGYTTKIDLSKFGSIMFMGLIGIVIASLVNLFMRSSAMDYIISFIGVLVFTGLTAYDVQKIKRMSGNVGVDGQTVTKLTILGALTLYLDFINLFLFLLRFFGGRK